MWAQESRTTHARTPPGPSAREHGQVAQASGADSSPAETTPQEPVPADPLPYGLAELAAEAHAAAAQQAEPPQGPQPVTPPEAPDPPCNPEQGDICLTADEQGREKGRIWGRGFADLRVGEMRVQTDAIDIYEVETPEGMTRRLVASGNVVLLRREERLMGTKLTMDINTGQGTMENAVGYIDPGVYFTAETLERLDPRTFRVHRARFTSCCQPNPRWGFRASSAKLTVNEKIVAKNVLFTVGVPVWPKNLPTPIYFPYFAYPLSKGDRATGLLMPSFSIDFKRGVDVRAGFFWAMGRSADQTFSYEYREKLSPRITHELRYLREGVSNGTFRTTFFPPTSQDAEPQAGLPPANTDWDFDFKWNAVQELPRNFVAKVNVNRNSPQNYLTALTNFYSRYEDSSLAVQGTFAGQSVRVLASERATIYDAGKAFRRYLPQLRLSMYPRRLGNTGIVADYSTQIDLLESAPRPENKRVDKWTRFDVFPSLQRPMSTSWLTVTPLVRARYTHYSATYPYSDEEEEIVTAGGPTDAALGRRYLEAAVQIEGPSFSRVFENPSGIVSDKFKHVIGPQVRWMMRSANEGSERVPYFDSVDNQYRTHELNYGLVNRFYLRRRSRPDAPPTPYEFLSWNVYQSYYLDVPKTTSDPNFSSELRGPGGTIVDRSPIRSRVRFQPVNGLGIDWIHEYDTAFKSTKRMDLRSRISGPLGNLDITWAKVKRAPKNAQELVLTDNTIGGRVDLRLFERALSLGGSATYSFTRELFMERSAHLRFDVQCFGLMFQLIERQYRAGEPVRSIGFAVELANLGSIGMDPDRTGPGQRRY